MGIEVGAGIELISSELENRGIVVYWTGGWDSTAMLYELAKTHATKDKPVIAFSVVSENIMQSPIEKKYREKLKDKFEKEGLNIVFNTMEENFSGNMDFGKVGICNNCGAEQPNFLLSTLWNLNRYNDLVVCFGYLEGDSIWHNIHEFKEIFYNMVKIQGSNNKVLFPLEYVGKLEVLKYLRENDLLDLTWYCESPTKEETPCGTCTSCKRVLACKILEKVENDCSKGG